MCIPKLVVADDTSHKLTISHFYWSICVCMFRTGWQKIKEKHTHTHRRRRQRQTRKTEMRKYKNAKTVSIHFTRAVYFYLIFHIHIYILRIFFVFPSRFLAIAPSCSDIFSSISIVSFSNRNDVGRLQIPRTLSLSLFASLSFHSFVLYE